MSVDWEWDSWVGVYRCTECGATGRYIDNTQNLHKPNCSGATNTEQPKGEKG